MKTSEVGLAIVKASLAYDPLTGAITWLVKPARRIMAGSVAGSIHRRFGYRVIKVGGMRLRASHVAWFLAHGEWPAAEVDHKNLDRDDNRLANLRLATRAQNGANRSRQKNNTSGFKGVSRHGGGRWRATIKSDRQQRFLGAFDTPEEAHAAYVAAASDLHGEFARAS
jgi:hypothetical protein